MKRMRLALANLPTPLWHNRALDNIAGTEVWVKRDDMSAGAEAGNKIRKLEYLLAEAVQRRTQVVITCGGFQSNHARATALLARGLGMRSVLFLRTAEHPPPLPDGGNAFLSSLSGAQLSPITPEQYANRDAIMEREAQALARRGQRAYVIPEGGSNGLGALGYVNAMREVREQLDAGEGGGIKGFDAVAHACGSGGTAAGVSLGAAHFGVAERTLAMAVAGDVEYFNNVIGRVVEEARALHPELSEPNALRVFDQWKGPGYAVPSTEQIRFIADVARTCGLVLDPVYTGKALFGLARMQDKPARVLFIHTGGLPGLLAQTDAFGSVLSAAH